MVIISALSENWKKIIFNHTLFFYTSMEMCKYLVHLAS